MKSIEKKIARLAYNDAYDIKTAVMLVDDAAWKTERISGYAKALETAYEKIDLSQEAKFFADQRDRLIKKGFTGEKVVASKLGRNIKIVVIAGIGIYALNEMGYLEKAKQAYRRGRLYVSALEDPESQEYKDFVDAMANKVRTFTDGEPHYKNRHTVAGETVEDTPEQKDALRQHVQDTAAGLAEDGSLDYGDARNTDQD